MSKQLTVPIPEQLQNMHKVLNPHTQGRSVTLSMDDDGSKICLQGDGQSQRVCLHRDTSDKPNVILLPDQQQLHCNDISNDGKTIGRVCFAWTGRM